MFNSFCFHSTVFGWLFVFLLVHRWKWRIWRSFHQLTGPSQPAYGERSNSDRNNNEYMNIDGEVRKLTNALQKMLHNFWRSEDPDRRPLPQCIHDLVGSTSTYWSFPIQLLLQASAVHHISNLWPRPVFTTAKLCCKWSDNNPGDDISGTVSSSSYNLPLLVSVWLGEPLLQMLVGLWRELLLLQVFRMMNLSMV